MNRNTPRIMVQVVSILFLVLLPAMESYRILLFYLPPGQTGLLAENSAYLSFNFPDYLNGGYISWLVKFLDYAAGIFSLDTQLVQDFLSYFGGTYWSVTLAGITIVDPLAFLQTLPFTQPLPAKFILAAGIPVALAAILGRFFCAWICPVNSIFQFSRLVFTKIGSTPNKKLVSGDHIRPTLLVVGIIAPLAGVAIFPFILPYLSLGRFLYSLSIGDFLWSALVFIITLVIIDTFIQRGFWCNFICPTGLLLALLGKRRLINIKYNKDVCLGNCSLCVKACPWNADPKEQYSTNCTNCMRCIDKCPVGALSYKTKL